LDSVELRVRLVAARELKAIRIEGLHEEMCGRCEDEVRRSVEATAHLYPQGSEPHLDEVVQSLAANLQAMPNLHAAVQEAYQLGSTGLVESEFFEAMALWVIDNQLGEGLVWRPAVPVTRRRRRRWWQKKRD
jgi:hypothetical protein